VQKSFWQKNLVKYLQKKQDAQKEKKTGVGTGNELLKPADSQKLLRQRKKI
jgi:hypothetical protein